MNVPRLRFGPVLRCAVAWIPAWKWLQGYRREWLRGDVIAGLTLAAYLLPAALGDASLARLPPEAGLYACVFSGLVFWLFCSSRQTVVTVTSAIALLMGASLGELSGGDPTRFGVLSAATAILVSAIAFMAWLARAGAIVNFISDSVMTGFKTGVALFLASTQLPKLLGLKAGHGDFWENCQHLLHGLPSVNPVATAVGVVALLVLAAGKIYLRNKPVALVVVIGGVVAASQWDLASHGVGLLGAIPQGLPSVGLPGLTRADINLLLPLACACFVLGAVETAAIGRMFGSNSGPRLDASQEFLALASANLACAAGGGLPVSGGMSQSLVNNSAGARTPVSGALAAMLLLLVAVFFAGVLRFLPEPVLAAVVLIAIGGLFHASTWLKLLRCDRVEFFVALAALVGVLGSGLLRGVLVGAAISLVQLIRRVSRPHVALLGRIPGTHRFSDCDRHLDNELTPGLMIFRPESSLVFFNIDYIRDAITSRIEAESAPPKLVLIDLSASPLMDLQSAIALAGLAEQLRGRGIRMQLAEARSGVRDRLRAAGLETQFGDAVSRFAAVADAEETFRKQAGSTPPSRAS
ncbi:MAG: SulP family inorganic anion transporter [Limisphaerales bacterium]